MENISGEMFFSGRLFSQKMFSRVWLVTEKYFLEKYISKTDNNFSKLDSVLPKFD